MIQERTPVRVLITGPSLQGQGAGIQQHVRYLMDAFGASGEFTITSFATTTVRYRESWLLKALRGSGLMFRFPRSATVCDVVHINSTIDRRSFIRDAVLVLLARLVRRPVVVQFHGGGIHRLRGVAGKVALMVGRSFRLADQVLFLSEGQGGPVASALSLKRVRFVSNYVDVSGGQAPRTPIAGSLRVAFLGRLDAEKGARETVEAFRAVAGPDWCLKVAGGGPDAHLMERAASEDCRILYLGFVGQEDRDDLLRWADVLCLPSDHDEGLPYAVLEAAAAGVALVTSDKGALGSIVVPGVTGLIVPPRDAEALGRALLSLDADPRRLAAMKVAAQELAKERFGFDTMRCVFGELWREAGARR